MLVAVSIFDRFDGSGLVSFGKVGLVSFDRGGLVSFDRGRLVVGAFRKVTGKIGSLLLLGHLLRFWCWKFARSPVI